ncbi:hypothetical protein HY58_03440 [Flavihumibacter sp. ZG627]|nr:hypothetical protein HY58_03440 [Flavihumibacter sp. ZG627]
MRTKITKLTRSANEGVCLYQVLVYRRLASKKNLVKIDDDVNYASVIVEINDPIIHIREYEYLFIIKATLNDYKLHNSTIRENQLVSNLKFSFKGCESRVKVKEYLVAQISEKTFVPQINADHNNRASNKTGLESRFVKKIDNDHIEI